MYEENKKKINWVKVSLEILLCLMVVLLSVKLVTVIKSKQRNKDVTNEYKKVLESMDCYAKEYFKNNLPDQSGKSLIIYLKSLVEDKKITKPDNCNLDESYIKVTRLDHEYQIKSYLVCDNFENSLNSFENIESTIVIKPTTSTVTTTKTTKKTTSKVKKYSVSFNSNGGSLINDIIVIENKNITNEPIPIREGYIFLGWYYHGKQFNFSTRINQDYVLTARWVKE